MAPDAPRRPWLLGAILAAITAAVVVALITSSPSGTGATNVGDAGPPSPGEQDRVAATPEASATATATPEASPSPSPSPTATATPEASPSASPTATATPARRRRCTATESNPGGTNNYIPDAPERASLGEGFVITGRVRAADGCRPLENVRIQVWLATETGGEQDNRASVRTDEDGRYRIETAPTIAQFGEPNIHVGYADGDYREVFIRRVVDLDDTRAVVDLTLARDA